MTSSQLPESPDPSNEGHVGDRFIRGAAWMLASKILEKILGLVSTLILARLLLPADFGLVALAAPVVGLVELLGALGIDSALIQKRNIKRHHLDTAFTLNLIIAAAITTLLWLAAPSAAEYFDEPRLLAVIRWLAFGNLIQGLANPGIIMLRKEINMAPEVFILLGKKTSSLLVATTAALLLGNYWALIWGMIISRLVGVGLSYSLSSFRPKFSLKGKREILGFSSWVLVIQLLNYLQLRANDLIIGKILGASHLAYFSVAIDLAATAPGEAMIAISRAAFPTLTKLSTNTQRLRLGLRNILSGVGLFALPAGFGIAATSELLVLVLLGPRWKPAAELAGTLAISSAILGIMGQISYVYLAIGRPRTSAFVSFLGVIALTGSSIILIPIHGLAGINIAYPLMAATITVGHIIFLRRLLPEFMFTDWVSAFWRPLISAASMYAIVTIFSGFLATADTSAAGITPLLLLIIIGILFYCFLVTILWLIAGSPDGPEALALTKIKTAMKRFLESKKKE